MLEFVSATRFTRDEFWERSALGRSLIRIEGDERWVPRVAFENRRGLPEVFNERIAAGSEHDILVFLHDDVFIDGLFIVDQVRQGLEEFHVLGVAGNDQRVPRQFAWGFVDITRDVVWDDRGHLHGGIGHGDVPAGPVTRFGETPAECELLDGVFMAARRSTLLEHGVRFDERFGFHFYDLDFCRSVRAKGLRLGTWPIALTHQSKGNWGSPEWQKGYADYIGKWKE